MLSNNKPARCDNKQNNMVNVAVLKNKYPCYFHGTRNNVECIRLIKKKMYSQATLLTVHNFLNIFSRKS